MTPTQFSQFLTGVYNFGKQVFGTLEPELEAMAQQRLDVCRSCEHFRLEADDVLTSHCFLCGCRTKIAILSPEKQCPDIPNRWAHINNTFNNDTSNNTDN
jgi:hypothetical protein